MPVDIVTDGFFGDCGKGKTVGYLALKDNYDIVVKAGSGPQSGHTATTGKFTQLLPSGFVNQYTRLLIGRGTVVDPNIILKEIEKYGTENRTGIDLTCTIIEPKHIQQEKELVTRVGSVGVGTGYARRDRILRKAKIAKDIASLKPYITNVAEEIDAALDENKMVLLEGVQGYGLSLFHPEFYPNVTSQDTTATQFASDAGVGCKDVGEIYLVLKAFVSRVGEGKGQKALRTLWTPEEKAEYGIVERGTVSGRERKLGHFDDLMAIEAARRNNATQGVITNIDRLFKGNDGVRYFDELTEEAQEFIRDKDTLLKENSRHFRGITLISTGTDAQDMIDTRGISF